MHETQVLETAEKSIAQHCLFGFARYFHQSSGVIGYRRLDRRARSTFFASAPSTSHRSPRRTVVETIIAIDVVVERNFIGFIVELMLMVLMIIMQDFILYFTFLFGLPALLPLVFHCCPTTQENVKKCIGV